MATELTLILRFDDDRPPTADDLEAELDCIVLEYREDEV